MTTLNEQMLGVKALTAKEMITTEGGVWPLIRAIVVAVAAIHEVTCDGSPHNYEPTFHAMDRGAW
jgi:lactobin A/cerein 7B family class IIb bacteriocin